MEKPTINDALQADIERSTASIIARGCGFGSDEYQTAVLSTVQAYVKNTLGLDGALAEDAVGDLIIDLYEDENTDD